MSDSHKNTPIHFCNYMMHWFMARVAMQKLHNRTLHGLFRQIKVGLWRIETSTCIALFSREVCLTNSSSSSWNIASRSIFNLSSRKLALIILQSFNANIFIMWFKVNVKCCSQPILLPWHIFEWEEPVVQSFILSIWNWLDHEKSLSHYILIKYYSKIINLD